MKGASVKLEDLVAMDEFQVFLNVHGLLYQEAPMKSRVDCAEDRLKAIGGCVGQLVYAVSRDLWNARCLHNRQVTPEKVVWTELVGVIKDWCKSMSEKMRDEAIREFLKTYAPEEPQS